MFVEIGARRFGEQRIVLQIANRAVAKSAKQAAHRARLVIVVYHQLLDAVADCTTLVLSAAHEIVSLGREPVAALQFVLAAASLSLIFMFVVVRPGVFFVIKHA